MTDKVVNIADFRKKSLPPTQQEIVAFCVTSVMDEWERFAKANKLTDFFETSCGSHLKPFTNYLSNLTELAVLEEKLGIHPGVWAPGINDPSQLGWRACFRYGDVLVETPDMAFEAHARACNVLIFQKLRRTVVGQ